MSPQSLTDATVVDGVDLAVEEVDPGAESDCHQAVDTTAIVDDDDIPY